MTNRFGADRYSRRDFLRTFSYGVSAAALFPHGASDALALTPKRPPESGPKFFELWAELTELPEDKKLGVALVGLGNYATNQLAPALQGTKLCKLAGIVTGTPAKIDVWRERYGIPEANVYNYETFDSIAENPDIDIVYVVLPNSMHADFTIRAAKAGKHVICEKPMATSVADAEAMVRACREHDRKLSVGYRLHFDPYHEEIMHLGRKKVLGPVEEISGRFSFDIGNNPDVWRLDGKLAGGGPLMDIGLYVIQASLYTVSELPIAVTARKTEGEGPLFAEVEKSIDWELEFPGGLVAKGDSSYKGRGNFHRVTADQGSFNVDPAYSYRGLQGRTSLQPFTFEPVNQQLLQMDAFAHHLLNGFENRVPGEMGLRDVKILYAIYEAAETGKRVELVLG